jgi:hypothetical protein
MAVIDDLASQEERILLQHAADQGLSLVQFETQTGALMWAWRADHGPAVQFATRSVALHWAREWFDREAELVA